MGKDIVGGDCIQPSHSRGRQIPNDDNLKNEAIMGFYDFASIWKELKDQDSKVAPDIILRYCLKDQKEWFISEFLSNKVE